ARSMIRAVVALLVAAGLACAAAPASQRARAIEPGVKVGPVAVGGLLAVPARERIAAALDAPLQVGDTQVAPRALGARLDENAAVSAALAATPGSTIALPVKVAPRKLDAFVASLAKRYNRAPVAQRVIGATDEEPEFAPGKAGAAVDQAAMRTAVTNALASHTPVKLITRAVPAKRLTGAVIVVNRAENKLRLFDGTKLVRVFSVATGQSIYPTPAGVWFIKDKQMNPWWYPPTYDAWAKGLKPVPPGPGNPLGTRWMGLNAPGVGIHGTDAPTSIGYSASHGCVRMQIPDAEWLFPHVSVGTPVVIL
ncbi:MAG TPA: L,D-transpeptidase family protein, partial [Gaiellaceae bacterium]|nr:L,D-transpeptidase family protein [Gaiellaceae bacterium]